MLSERPEFARLGHKISGAGPVIGTAMENGIRESDGRGVGARRIARAATEGDGVGAFVR
jgi:hypothetical protein